MTVDVEAVRAAVFNFMAALDRGDLEGLADLWDSEIVVANDGVPTVIGAEALRSKYLERMAAYSTRSGWVEEGIVVRGDTAVILGRFTIAMSSKVGAADRQAKGRVLLAYHRSPMADGCCWATATMTDSLRRDAMNERRGTRATVPLRFLAV